MEIVDFKEYNWHLRKNGLIQFHTSDGEHSYSFVVGSMMRFRGQNIVQTKNIWGETIYLEIDITKLCDAFGKIN